MRKRYLDTPRPDVISDVLFQVELYNYAGLGSPMGTEKTVLLDAVITADPTRGLLALLDRNKEFRDYREEIERLYADLARRLKEQAGLAHFRASTARNDLAQQRIPLRLPKRARSYDFRAFGVEVSRATLV